jgi:hypothetical protein
MNRYCSVSIFALMLLLVTLPAQAERLACKATYDISTGTLNIDAVDVGSNRYVVKLVSITGGTSLRFKLDTATLTSNHDCYDAVAVSTTTLAIPDITVADSFYNATLTLVAGNGPTQIDLTTSNTSTMQFDLTSSSKNPRLVPDAGLRIDRAGLPFATVNSSSGITYLGYQDAAGGPVAYKSASDGLTFSNPVTLTYNNRSVDSRRTLMPDGTTWRLYEMSQAGVMTSYISSDGNVFTAETGTRYTAQAADYGKTGVYDIYKATDNALVLVYLGDLMGKNNLRMAKSTDNGVTFTYLKGNVLGDDNAGGAFVDNKTILLADGRRRMLTMRGGELQSFVTSEGYTWSREPGTRIGFRDFATVGVTLYSLNDPVAVFDKNSNLKVYVAASTAAFADTPGNTNWAIVSATWNDTVGSGVLGANGACGASNGKSFPAAPSTNLCTTGTPSSVTGSGPWSWICAGSNGGVAATCTGYEQTLIWTISSGTGGNGSLSCTSPVNNGATSTCTVTPATGYQLDTFTDNGADKKSSVLSGSYSITSVTATHTIAANFTLIPPTPATQFTVTPTIGSGFTIIPATPLTINNNAATSFTITPAPGFGITSVTGCSGSLNGTTYITGPVTANCSVSVTAVARTAGSGTSGPTISDALKVLQAVAGISTLTATEQIRYDVAPLSSTGTPLGNGALDAADVILILRRSIGIGNW